HWSGDRPTRAWGGGSSRRPRDGPERHGPVGAAPAASPSLLVAAGPAQRIVRGSDALVALKILGGSRHHATPVARGRTQLAHRVQKAQKGGMLQPRITLCQGLIGLLAGLTQQQLEMFGIEGHEQSPEGSRGSVVQQVKRSS